MQNNRTYRVAEKLLTMLMDTRLDPVQIGTYFARIAPRNIYERFDLMVQGAEVEKTERDIMEGAEKNVYKFFNQV